MTNNKCSYTTTDDSIFYNCNYISNDKGETVCSKCGNKPMTNNNWVNTWLRNTYGLQDDDLLNAGDIEELCRQMTQDLLTKKDQEHKAELEMIKGEIKEYFEGLIHVPNPQLTGNNIVSILDSHINKLT